MNIEISDEMIQEMVRDQVKNRINLYLSAKTKDNPYWITDTFRNCVSEEVRKLLTDENLQKFCADISKDALASRIIDKFADKLLRCFDD